MHGTAVLYDSVVLMFVEMLHSIGLGFGPSMLGWCRAPQAGPLSLLKCGMHISGHLTIVWEG